MRVTCGCDSFMRDLVRAFNGVLSVVLVLNPIRSLLVGRVPYNGTCQVA